MALTATSGGLTGAFALDRAREVSLKLGTEYIPERALPSSGGRALLGVTSEGGAQQGPQR